MKRAAGLAAALDRHLRDTSVRVDEGLAVKRTAFVTQGAVALLAACTVIYSLITAWWSMLVLSGAGLFGTVAAGAQLLATRRLLPSSVAVWLLLLGTLMLCGDYISFGTMDIWTLEVLVMDGLIAFTAPPWSAKAMITLVTVYLVCRSMLDDHGFWVEIGDAQEYTDLRCPAKAFHLAVMVTFYRVGAFVCDFIITRTFAAAVRSQYEVMKVSQEVTETLAALLSRYEVELAQAAVEDERSESLPPALRESFRQLVANLTSYKPFLPQSCLPREREMEEEGGSYILSPGTSATPRPNLDADLLRQHTLSSSESHRISGVPEDVSPANSPRAAGVQHAVTPLSPLRSSSMRAVLSAVQRSRVSCLCTNHRGFLSQIEGQELESVTEWVGGEVGYFTSCTNALRGVVDRLCGDHFLSSFNAARRCATHRVSAARCADAYSQKDPGSCVIKRVSDRRESTLHAEVTTAVCTGTCICGDFGNSTIVRFMIIGQVPNHLSFIERLAANWKVRVLVDSCTHGDLADTWRCRLRCSALWIKQGVSRSLLWELDGERLGQCGERDSPQEWMYELAEAGPDPWQQHARAMRLWLERDFAGAAEAASAPAEPEGAPQLPELQEALKQLAAAAAAEEEPPVVPFYEPGNAAVTLADREGMAVVHCTLELAVPGDTLGVHSGQSAQRVPSTP
eukprot:TRINITY_DN23654_c0_g1_i1.p1 TRINITY_DN23654_c0_g1~~TRINITY_DN23654_c0_g1_i1.p1  ORF type:complete len:680 (+),score=186.57 TRINITY_DN23654_c0_g1_i1:102-2141(+)